MIELVEAMLLAQQLETALSGKRIVDVTQGNSSHKFAFLSGTEQEYRERLIGQILGKAWAHGASIFQMAGNDHVIILGEGGERILFHERDETWPKKRQLELSFEDGTSLTVTISGWGSVRALPLDQVKALPYLHLERISPLDEKFTTAFWQSLFGVVDEGYSKAIKYFMISEPGVLGVGNGYLQDILFHAGIHPRIKVPTLDAAQRMALYDATISTLQTALEQGGRDTEVDICGHKGSYVRLLDARTQGQPCPKCGAVIEKISFLGGACYFCPRCQPMLKA